uniref:Uncharacterized protein n=1 Tax=viral metagenome TaxID=1070528 RepID=A0A6C0LSF0_9ZZZZ
MFIILNNLNNILVIKNNDILYILVIKNNDILYILFFNF